MTRAVLQVPYGFAEFERRAQVLQRRRRLRTATLRGACALSVLVAFAIAWAGTRPAQVASAPMDPFVPSAVAPAPTPLTPAWAAGGAVVRVETRLSVLALEERIALVDDLLSDAQAGSDPLRRVQRLERERALLADSLQRVQHAEALLRHAEEPRPSLLSR
jgi:hypothetical protein